MSDRYGATPEAWNHFSSTLGLTADLLPAVANPNAEISETSALTALGKTPSRYNAQRKVVGIAKWTEVSATATEVARWSQEPDYSISVITRRLRALDLDIAKQASVDQVMAVIRNHLGEDFPIRFRENSPKILIPFWYDAPLTKHVIPVEDGMVEILADGQQFIAEGTHPSGSRYEWNSGDVIPVLDEIDLAMLLADLKELATGEIKVARQRRVGNADDLAVHDEVADWLIANWETYDVGGRGELQMLCPFADEHTSDTGPSSTAYFPAGTGGYEQGHFVCLHAHCTGRSDHEFTKAIGYDLAQFDDLTMGEPADGRGGEDAAGDRLAAGDEGNALSVAEACGLEPWPTLKRNKAGEIMASADNMVKMLSRCDIIGRHLAYDAFKDELVWAPGDQCQGQQQWRPFLDHDYVDVRIALERRGMQPMGKDLLREAINRVAWEYRFDTAIEWLSRLAWDGVERVERFCIDGWGWADNAYSRAVGRYIWSALAGRVLEPGVQADMVPILVGPQGIRKTSSVKAMVPDPEFYVTLPLDAKDDDTSRLLRGKLVAELEELRGLNSKAIEEIKAWVTKQEETWVPKFKEFAKRYGRRNLLIGTTNEDEILNDPTGERRWLPGRCGEMDIDWIKANRNQLWAEGAAMFAVDGVDWQEAETLAINEHAEYKMTDGWEPYVIRWLHDENASMTGIKPIDQPYITTVEALAALGFTVHQIDRGKEMRMGKVLKHLRFERKKQRRPDSGFEWGYVKV